MLALTFADSDNLAEIFGPQTLLWGHDDDGDNTSSTDDSTYAQKGKDGAEANENAA